MINEKNFFAENKKINVSNTASLVNLKAELFKRKQDAIKSKSLNKNAEFELINQTKDVSNAKWNKKAIEINEKIRDSIRNKKAENVSKNQISQEEEARLEKEIQRSKANLIRKAKLYEEKMKNAYDSLKNREEMKDEEDDLIDFERKIIDASKSGLLEENELFNKAKTNETETTNQEDQEELVEYVDSFGRTRMCKRKELSGIEKINEQILLRRKLDRDLTKDDDDKFSRSKAYPDLYSNFTKSKETDESDDESHYQKVSKDEIREHGTSYYQFSLDKEKRKEQMENLDEMRKQTVEQRKKADQLIEKRNEAMKSRLLKLAKRKGLVKDDDDQINLDQYIANQPKKEEHVDVESKIDYSLDVKERKLREWDMDKNEFTIDRPNFFIDKKGESSKSQSNRLDEEYNSSDEELSKFKPEFAPPANLYNDTKRKKFKSQLNDDEEIEDKVDEFLKFTLNKSRQ